MNVSSCFSPNELSFSKRVQKYDFFLLWQAILKKFFIIAPGRFCRAAKINPHIHKIQIFNTGVFNNPCKISPQHVKEPP